MLHDTILRYLFKRFYLIATLFPSDGFVCFLGFNRVITFKVVPTTAMSDNKFFQLINKLIQVRALQLFTKMLFCNLENAFTQIESILLFYFFRDEMTSLPPVFESRGTLPPLPPSHRDLINSACPNTGIVNKLVSFFYYRSVLIKNRPFLRSDICREVKL